METKSKLEVAADVKIQYNPLSKVDCFRAAIRKFKDNVILEPILPTENEYVADSVIGKHELFKEYKELYFPDEDIRLLNILSNPDDPAGRVLDNTFDVMSLDPGYFDGYELWKALLTPEEKETVEGLNLFKYSVIDNLLFIGQVVMTTKALYEIEDKTPSFKSASMSHAETVMLSEESQNDDLGTTDESV